MTRRGFVQGARGGADGLAFAGEHGCTVASTFTWELANGIDSSWSMTPDRRATHISGRGVDTREKAQILKYAFMWKKRKGESGCERGGTGGHSWAKTVSDPLGLGNRPAIDF